MSSSPTSPSHPHVPASPSSLPPLLKLAQEVKDNGPFPPTPTTPQLHPEKEAKAFFILSQDNWLRASATRLSSHPYFDRLVLIVILLNCVFLVVSDPLCLGVGTSVPPDDSNATCTKSSTSCAIQELERHPCVLFCAQWKSRRAGYKCNDFTQMAVDRSEIVFQVLFTLEMLIKMVVKGLILHPGSYLRDAWGVIDFVVVTVGWLGFIPGVGNMSVLRMMRVLRPLRTMNRIPGLQPLISSLFNALRMLLNVMGLFAFVFLLFGIMGVQMMTGALHNRCVFANGEYVDMLAEPVPLGAPERLCSPTGTGRNCPANITRDGASYFVKCANMYRDEGAPVGQLQEIPNPDWSMGIIHFDDVFSGCLVIFQVIAIEGWAEVFYHYSEAWNEIIAHFYFTLLIILGSWFVINLALAVISDSFSKAMETAEDDRIASQVATYNEQHADSAPLDAEDALAAIAAQREETEAQYCLPAFKESKVVAMSRRIVEAKQFQTLIMCLILLNVLLLAMDFFDEGTWRRNWLKAYRNETNILTYIDYDHCEVDQWGYPVHADYGLCGALINAETNQPVDLLLISEGLNELLVAANYVLTVVFLTEMILKLIGLGFRLYARDPFNVFDSVVVVASLIEIGVSLMFSGGGTSILSVFRVLRLFRVFKLARSWSSLRKVLGMLIASAKSLLSLMIVLSLFIFMFSLLGMQLFGGNYRFRQPGVVGSNPRYNFDGFLPDTGPDAGYGAVITIFQVLTGDSWNLNMYHAMASTNVAFFIFFWVLILFGNYIIMNLFVAVLLNGASMDEGDAEDETPDVQQMPHRVKLLFFSSCGSLLSKVANERHQERIRRAEAGLPPLPPLEHEGDDINIDEEDGDDEVTGMARYKHKALFCFPPHHPLRMACIALVEHWTFQWFILFCIIVSSLTMAVENPALDESDLIPQVIEYTDIFFASIFSTEVLVKIVAMGLYRSKHGYLRDPWNRLDVFIVAASIIPLAAKGNPGVSRAISVFRVRIFRVLRPLRMLKRNPGMKLVVNCLLQSIPAMMNVVFVILLIFVTFGILGMQFFKGKFFVCKGPAEYVPLHYTAEQFAPGQTYNETLEIIELYVRLPYSNDPITNYVDSQGVLRNISNWYECENTEARGVWVEDPQHFNNVPKALLTLFQLATLDSWTRVMDLGLDSPPTPGQMLRRMANPGLVVFFVFFLFIGSFFVINLFVGVVFENYVKLQQSAEGSIMTDSQKQWVTTTRALLRARPLRKIAAPDNKFRASILKLVQQPVFEKGVMVLIILNIAVMASNVAKPAPVHSTFIRVCGIVFTVLFALECILKNIGMGPVLYFKEGWNRFDFLVVIASIIGLFDFASETLVLQVLRVFRVFKLLRVAKGLLQLITILISSLPSLVNVGALLCLIVYIYAVVGVQLFWNLKIHGPFTEHSNFVDFSHAFFTLFRVTTFYGWSAMMNEASRGICNECSPINYDKGKCDSGCGGLVSSYIFFVTFVMASVFVMLNLFIAIILDNFTLEMGGVDARLGVKSIDSFAQIWSDLDTQKTMMLDRDKVFTLLRRLEPPLGCGQDCPKADVYKLITELDVQLYDGKFLYDEFFHALAFRVSGVELPEAVDRKLDNVRNLFGRRAFKKYLKQHRFSTDPKRKLFPKNRKQLTTAMEDAKSGRMNQSMAAIIIQTWWKACYSHRQLDVHVLQTWHKAVRKQTPAKRSEHEPNFVEQLEDVNVVLDISDPPSEEEEGGGDDDVAANPTDASSTSTFVPQEEPPKPKPLTRRASLPKPPPGVALADMLADLSVDTTTQEKNDSKHRKLQRQKSFMEPVKERSSKSTAVRVTPYAGIASPSTPDDESDMSSQFSSAMTGADTQTLEQQRVSAANQELAAAILANMPSNRLNMRPQSIMSPKLLADGFGSDCEDEVDESPPPAPTFLHSHRPPGKRFPPTTLTIDHPTAATSTARSHHAPGQHLRSTPAYQYTEPHSAPPAVDDRSTHHHRQHTSKPKPRRRSDVDHYAPTHSTPPSLRTEHSTLPHRASAGQHYPATTGSRVAGGGVGGGGGARASVSSEESTYKTRVYAHRDPSLSSFSSSGQEEDSEEDALEDAQETPQWPPMFTAAHAQGGGRRGGGGAGAAGGGAAGGQYRGGGGAGAAGGGAAGGQYRGGGGAGIYDSYRGGASVGDSMLVPARSPKPGVSAALAARPFVGPAAPYQVAAMYRAYSEISKALQCRDVSCTAGVLDDLEEVEETPSYIFRAAFDPNIGT